MHTIASYRRRVIALLLLLLAPLALPAHAGMVETADVLSEARDDNQRAEVLALLERSEVEAHLEALGVEPAAARARVAAMTNAEIAQLHARIEDMPAGGSSVLTAALVVFVVFVVTDVIGATDIFPFVRPVQ